MTNKKSFLKIGIIYTVGQILSKAISFIMLPIYTRELGTIGFGQLSLVDTMMNFISTFLILSIFSGYIRFYREYSEAERDRLRNTAINFAIIMTVVNLLLLAMFGKAISGIVFNFDNAHQIFVLLVIRSIMAQFITLLMCDYSLNYDAKKMVIINFVMMILNIIFVIIFVVNKSEGIIGIYKAHIWGSASILIYLILVQMKKFKLEFDKSMFKNMFIFSSGLIPCNLSATILDLADRYFLAGYKGFEQTGIYSMGYKLGMLIDPVFISPFKSIFTTYKFEIWKEKNAEKKFNEMFVNYHVVGCLIILMISFYSKLIIKVLATDEYLLAANLIPLILFSYFIYGENEFFSLGIQLKNKTYVTSIIMLVGGIANIILNIILIPKYGMYGAAIATLISYLIINMINIEVSKRFHEIVYNFKKSYTVDGVAILIYLIYFIVASLIDNIVIESVVGTLFLFIYLFIMIKLKFISYYKIKDMIVGKLK